MSNKKKTAEEQQETMDQQTQVMEEEPLTDGQEDQTAEDQMDAAAENDEVIELKQQVGELKDKYMRIYAEFENFKKRTVREKMEWMKTAAQDTMSALLPVLDDFDRAKKFADEKSETGFSEGVELVYQKLYNALKTKGLEPMESTGKVFDPELHDAITEIPAPSEDLKGKVVDTIEKGYRLNDKIIRHAKVVVGK